jgi:hypothetical protein
LLPADLQAALAAFTENIMRGMRDLSLRVEALEARLAAAGGAGAASAAASAASAATVAGADAGAIGPCMVCGAPSAFKCSRCEAARYCGRQHQKDHWPSHKPVCSTTHGEAGGGAGGAGAAAATRAGAELQLRASWAAGQSAEARYEWLVDCYRLRVDDDYAMGGGITRGLYASSSVPEAIVWDLADFCKLALRAGVVPVAPVAPSTAVPWDWRAFLAQAAELVTSAFDKRDAQDKYGRENVFAGMLGGRSLRYTATLVYGDIGAGASDAAASIRRDRAGVQTRDPQLKGGESSPAGTFFADIGGVAAWRKLLADVKHELE